MIVRSLSICLLLFVARTSAMWLQREREALGFAWVRDEDPGRRNGEHSTCHSSGDRDEREHDDPGDPERPAGSGCRWLRRDGLRVPTAGPIRKLG
jgi:hypothetical protein